MVNMACNSKTKSFLVSILACFFILVFFLHDSLLLSPQIEKNVNEINIQKQSASKEKNNEFINPLIRSLKSFETVSNFICRSDKEKLQMLNNVNFEKQTSEFLQNLFYKLISNPVGGRCGNLQRVGGTYLSGCHYWDGHKFVCMPELIQDIENNECLIYSFGVFNDWTFEKALGAMGCKVFSFDPSVDHPKELEHNVWFEKLGLGIEKDDAHSMDTLSSIVQKYGHENNKISYLKIDIEGGEVNGLQHWLQSGALENVQQIGMEYHLQDKDSVVKFFKAIQKLYFQYDFRLISFDINGCYGKEHRDFPKLAEIVLMKRNRNSYCID